MKTSDFYFELPHELIAQYPLDNRTDSKLLHYHRDTKQISHHSFREMIDILRPGDLLVMNDSFVIPARLYGEKETRGKVELLIERVLESSTFLAHIKASKAPKSGTRLFLPQEWEIEVIEKQDDLYYCRVVEGEVLTLLDEVGHVPLPLYITRDAALADSSRYQTVYAKHKGSVAAPTAGLHFDEQLLSDLQRKGVELGFITLHIGAGTFRPVRVETITEHRMHREWFEVSETLCKQISETKARGNRVIAVGTTAMRSLESAARHGTLTPTKGDTDIFIYPGFHFRVCDGLVTNFHLPESTLLMLVAAFIGHSEALMLYQAAISHRYRFYSYGDSSLLL
jgi:S-adenosylmethionine:tRNA ribosyltransferase-isomerase